MTKHKDSSIAPMVRLLVVVVAVGATVYGYIHKQNALTEIRLSIPTLQRDLKKIQDENVRLQYEIERFESPLHLMELARKPEFAHLRYPSSKEVIVLKNPPRGDGGGDAR